MMPERAASSPPGVAFHTVGDASPASARAVDSDRDLSTGPEDEAKRMSKLSTLLLLLIACASSRAERQTENVILVTLDGVRIQELFAGMDPLLAARSESVDYSD